MLEYLLESAFQKFKKASWCIQRSLNYTEGIKQGFPPNEKCLVCNIMTPDIVVYKFVASNKPQVRAKLSAHQANLAQVVDTDSGEGTNKTTMSWK